MTYVPSFAREEQAPPPADVSAGYVPSFARDDVLAPPALSTPEPASYLNFWIGRPLSTPINQLDGGLDYVDLLQKNTEGRQGFGEGISPGLEDVPFTGDLVTIGRATRALGAVQKLNQGQELTDQELLDFNLYVAANERRSNATWGGKVGQTIWGLVKFGSEFAGYTALFGAGVLGAVPTGGTSAAVAGAAGVGIAAKQAAFKTLIKSTGKAVEDYLINRLGAGAAAKLTARTAGLLTKGVVAGAAPAAAQAAVQGIFGAATGAGFTTAGAREKQIVAEIQNRPMSDAAAFFYDAGDMFVEYMSEFSGGVLGRGITKGVGFLSESAGKTVGRLFPEDFAELWRKRFGVGDLRQFGKMSTTEAVAKATAAAEEAGTAKWKAVAGAYLGSVAYRNGVNLDTAARMIRTAGYNGFVEEMLEERFGGFVRGLTGLQAPEGAGTDWGLRNAWDQMWPSIEDLSVEAVAFATPLVALGAIHGVQQSMLPGGIDSFQARINELVSTVTPQVNKVVDEKAVDDPKVYARGAELIRQMHDTDKQFEPGVVGNVLNFLSALVTFDVGRTQFGTYERAIAMMQLAPLTRMYGLTEADAIARGSAPEVARSLAEEVVAHTIQKYRRTVRAGGGMMDQDTAIQEAQKKYPDVTPAEALRKAVAAGEVIQARRGDDWVYVQRGEVKSMPELVEATLRAQGIGIETDVSDHARFDLGVYGTADYVRQISNPDSAEYILQMNIRSLDPWNKNHRAIAERLFRIERAAIQAMSDPALVPGRSRIRGLGDKAGQYVVQKIETDGTVIADRTDQSDPAPVIFAPGEFEKEAPARVHLNWVQRITGTRKELVKYVEGYSEAMLDRLFTDTGRTKNVDGKDEKVYALPVGAFNTKDGQDIFLNPATLTPAHAIEDLLEAASKRDAIAAGRPAEAFTPDVEATLDRLHKYVKGLKDRDLKPLVDMLASGGPQQVRHRFEILHKLARELLLGGINDRMADRLPFVAELRKLDPAALKAAGVDLAPIEKHFSRVYGSDWKAVLGPAVAEPDPAETSAEKPSEKPSSGKKAAAKPAAKPAVAAKTAPSETSAESSAKASAAAAAPATPDATGDDLVQASQAARAVPPAAALPPDATADDLLQASQAAKAVEPGPAAGEPGPTPVVAPPPGVDKKTLDDLRRFLNRDKPSASLDSAEPAEPEDDELDPELVEGTDEEVDLDTEELADNPNVGENEPWQEAENRILAGIEANRALVDAFEFLRGGVGMQRPVNAVVQWMQEHAAEFDAAVHGTPEEFKTFVQAYPDRKADPTGWLVHAGIAGLIGANESWTLEDAQQRMKAAFMFYSNLELFELRQALLRKGKVTGDLIRNKPRIWEELERVAAGNVKSIVGGNETQFDATRRTWKGVQQAFRAALGKAPKTPAEQARQNDALIEFFTTLTGVGREFWAAAAETPERPGYTMLGVFRQAMYRFMYPVEASSPRFSAVNLDRLANEVFSGRPVDTERQVSNLHYASLRMPTSLDPFIRTRQRGRTKTRPALLQHMPAVDTLREIWDAFERPGSFQDFVQFYVEAKDLDTNNVVDDNDISPEDRRALSDWLWGRGRLLLPRAGVNARMVSVNISSLKATRKFSTQVLRKDYDKYRNSLGDSAADRAIKAALPESPNERELVTFYFQNRINGDFRNYIKNGRLDPNYTVRQNQNMSPGQPHQAPARIYVDTNKALGDKFDGMIFMNPARAEQRQAELGSYLTGRDTIWSDKAHFRSPDFLGKGLSAVPVFTTDRMVNTEGQDLGAVPALQRSVAALFEANPTLDFIVLSSAAKVTGTTPNLGKGVFNDDGTLTSTALPETNVFSLPGNRIYTTQNLMGAVEAAATRAGIQYIEGILKQMPDHASAVRVLDLMRERALAGLDLTDYDWLRDAIAGDPRAADLLSRLNQVSRTSVVLSPVLFDKALLALQRKVVPKLNTVAVVKIGEGESFLKPMRRRAQQGNSWVDSTTGDRVAFGWAVTSAAGVREARIFDSVESAIERIASRPSAWVDLIDPADRARPESRLEGDVRSRIRTWEFEVLADGRVVVPGEFLSDLRIPAEGPQSATPLRVYHRLDSEANVAIIPEFHRLKKGEDFDGDKGFDAHLVKDAEGNVLLDNSAGGLNNRLLFSYLDSVTAATFPLFQRDVTEAKQFFADLAAPYRKEVPANILSAEHEERTHRVFSVWNDVLGIAAVHVRVMPLFYRGKIGLRKAQRLRLNGRVTILDTTPDTMASMPDELFQSWKYWLGTGLVNTAVDDTKEQNLEALGLNKFTTPLLLAYVYGHLGRVRTEADIKAAIERGVAYIQSPAVQEYARLRAEQARPHAKYMPVVSDSQPSIMDLVEAKHPKEVEGLTFLFNLSSEFFKIQTVSNLSYGRMPARTPAAVTAKLRDVDEVFSPTDAGLLDTSQLEASGLVNGAKIVAAQLRRALSVDIWSSPVFQGFIATEGAALAKKLGMRQPSVRMLGKWHDKARQAVLVNSMLGFKMPAGWPAKDTALQAWLDKAVEENPGNAFLESLEVRMRGDSGAKSWLSLNNPMRDPAGVSPFMEQRLRQAFSELPRSTRASLMLHSAAWYGANEARGPGNYAVFFDQESRDLRDELERSEYRRWMSGQLDAARRKAFVEAAMDRAGYYYPETVLSQKEVLSSDNRIEQPAAAPAVSAQPTVQAPTAQERVRDLVRGWYYQPGIGLTAEEAVEYDRLVADGVLTTAQGARLVTFLRSVRPTYDQYDLAALQALQPEELARVEKEISKVVDAATAVVFRQENSAPAAAPEVSAVPAVQAAPVSFEPDGSVNVYFGAGQNKELSNLALRPFVLGGNQFFSVEHAYQSLKSNEGIEQPVFSNPAWARGGVKIVGKKTADTKTNIELMENLVRTSFRQNPAAAQTLLATGSAPITHKQDKGIWRTEFPRILMAVRAELRGAAPEVSAVPAVQASGPLSEAEQVRLGALELKAGIGTLTAEETNELAQLILRVERPSASLDAPQNNIARELGITFDGVSNVPGAPVFDVYTESTFGATLYVPGGSSLEEVRALVQAKRQEFIDAGNTPGSLSLDSTARSLVAAATLAASPMVVASTPDTALNAVTTSLIARNEGNRNNVYDDVGFPAVGPGYRLFDDRRAEFERVTGANFDDVKAGRTQLTDAQSRQLLRLSTEKALAAARQDIEDFDQLNPGTRAHIADLYHWGVFPRQFPKAFAAAKSHEWRTVAAELRNSRAYRTNGYKRLEAAAKTFELEAGHPSFSLDYVGKVPIENQALRDFLSERIHVGQVPYTLYKKKLTHDLKPEEVRIAHGQFQSFLNDLGQRDLEGQARRIDEYLQSKDQLWRSSVVATLRQALAEWLEAQAGVEPRIQQLAPGSEAQPGDANLSASLMDWDDYIRAQTPSAMYTGNESLQRILMEEANFARSMVSEAVADREFLRKIWGDYSDKLIDLLPEPDDAGKTFEDIFKVHEDYKKYRRFKNWVLNWRTAIPWTTEDRFEATLARWAGGATMEIEDLGVAEEAARVPVQINRLPASMRERMRKATDEDEARAGVDAQTPGFQGRYFIRRDDGTHAWFIPAAELLERWKPGNPAYDKLIKAGRKPVEIDPLQLARRMRRLLRTDYDAISSRANRIYAENDYLRFRRGYLSHFYGYGLLGPDAEKVLLDLERQIYAAPGAAVQKWAADLGYQVTRRGLPKEPNPRQILELLRRRGANVTNMTEAGLVERMRRGEFESNDIDRSWNYADLARALEEAVRREFLTRNLTGNAPPAPGQVDLVPKLTEEEAALLKHLGQVVPKFNQREFSGRTRPRRYSTFMQAWVERGWLPRTMDPVEVRHKYVTDIYPTVFNNFTLAQMILTKDITGAPMVVAVPSRADGADLDESVLKTEIWKQQLQQLAEYFGEPFDLRGDIGQQTLDIVAKHLDPRVQTKAWSTVVSPYASVSRFLTVNREDHGLLDQLVGGETKGILEHIVGQRAQMWVFGRDILADLTRINAWMKANSVGASLFFPFAMVESILAGTGLKKNFLWTTPEGKAAWSAVKQNLDQIRKFRQMLRVNAPEMREFRRMFELAGLPIDIHASDQQIGWVDKDIAAATKRVRTLFGDKTADNFNRVFGLNSAWAKVLFNDIFPTFKLWASYRLFTQMRAMPQNRGLTDVELATRIAPMMNDAYGGQDWNRYSWATPKVLQVLNLSLFASNWTLSAWNIGGGGILTGQVLKNTMTPDNQDFVLRQNWPAMIAVVLFGMPVAIQAALFGLGAMTGAGDPDDTPWNFLNEKSRKTYIDITPLARLVNPFYTGEPTDRRRVFVRFGKQAYEVIDGWLTEPLNQFLRKLSQPAKLVFEQVTGMSPGSDWNLEFQGQGFAGMVQDKYGGFLGSRIGYTVQKFLPMSIISAVKNPGSAPAGFFAPVSKGMSAGTATSLSAGVLMAYARDDSYSLLKRAPKQQAALTSLVADYLDAAARNGYDPEIIFDTARGQVLGGLYKQFYTALDKNDTREMDKLARQILRVHGTIDNVMKSVQTRDKAYGKVATRTPEEYEMIRSAFQ